MPQSQSDRKFVELLGKVPNVAVQGYNRERVVIYWNKASEEIYGYSAQEALGKKLEDLIIPDFMREDLIKFTDNWYQNGVEIPAGEVPLKNKDGSTVFVYSSHVMLGEGTDNPEMFCMDIDLREMKRQEKELKEQEQMMIQQSRQAAMGEMIGNIAHQWRQPLNALGLVLQNIELEYEDGALNDEFMQHSIGKGTKLIQTMSKTIDDFRNFFKHNKHKEYFHIAVVINNTIELVEASFKNNNIEIKTDLDETVQFDGYPSEFSQVILNLLSNAKDALMQKDAEDKRVTISAFKKESSLMIEVADNAGGIPDNLIEKIFEPYFTTKEEGKGTGIGLHMSETIIKTNMGGNLSAKNSNEGAVFTIELHAN